MTSMAGQAGAQRVFRFESEMRELVATATVSLFCSGGGSWVLLDEHQIHARIPDLVAARIDRAALAERLHGGWARALSTGELRALRLLRADRGRTATSVAARLGVAEPRARRLLAGLAADGFAAQSTQGSYVRLAPIRPVLDRVVCIESKRSDLRGAFSQARAHSAFADVSVVVFDDAYRHRARRLKETYGRAGIGLLGLSADDGSWAYVQRPGPNALVGALGRAIAAERTLARLLGQALRRLPQTKLPGGSHSSVSPSAPRLLGAHSTALARSLPGCERLPAGR